MKSLFFTHQHQRYTQTLRIHYGLKSMKYIIKIYEGEINGHEENEGFPTKYRYEFEEGMLNHIYEIRNELKNIGWIQKESQEVHKTSFLRGEDIDA